MRAIATFSDIVPLYLEMKERGVQMDTDTMFIMISRAARHSEVTAHELFLLYGEMKELGARPDLVIVELMHTSLDHAVHHTTPEWQQMQKRKLALEYLALLEDEVDRLSSSNLGALLQAQFLRYRSNIKKLGYRTPTKFWVACMSRLHHFNDLLECFVGYLWDWVEPHNTQPLSMAQVSAELSPNYRLPVPRLHFLLHRLDGTHPLNKQELSASEKVQNTVLTDIHNKLLEHPVHYAIYNEESSCQSLEGDAEVNVPVELHSLLNAVQIANKKWSKKIFQKDEEINAFFLACLERVIMTPLSNRDNTADDARHTAILEPNLQIRLLYAVFCKAGVYINANTLAQLMDCAKFLLEDVHAHYNQTLNSTSAGELHHNVIVHYNYKLNTDYYDNIVELTPEFRAKYVKEQEQLSLRLLKHSIKGTALKADPYSVVWKLDYKDQIGFSHLLLDGRIIGRYIAARDPFSEVGFAVNSNTDSTPLRIHNTTENMEGALTAKFSDLMSFVNSTNVLLLPELSLVENSQESHSCQFISSITTTQRQREESAWWNFMEHSGLWEKTPTLYTLEVFTGIIKYIEKFILLIKYPLTKENQPTMTSGIISEVISCLNQWKECLDQYMSKIDPINILLGHNISVYPQVEAYESALRVTKILMNEVTFIRKQSVSNLDELFKPIAIFRNNILQECKHKYGKQLSVLWLENA